MFQQREELERPTREFKLFSCSNKVEAVEEAYRRGLQNNTYSTNMWRRGITLKEGLFRQALEQQRLYRHTSQLPPPSHIKWKAVTLLGCCAQNRVLLFGC